MTLDIEAVLAQRAALRAFEDDVREVAREQALLAHDRFLVLAGNPVIGRTLYGALTEAAKVCRNYAVNYFDASPDDLSLAAGTLDEWQNVLRRIALVEMNKALDAAFPSNVRAELIIQDASILRPKQIAGIQLTADEVYIRDQYDQMVQAISLLSDAYNQHMTLIETLVDVDAAKQYNVLDLWPDLGG